ncbi:MAG: Spy/CpxP family protein refolding chaperone [Bradyrhizobiaceae bacterium]|nr:Spy/CpxP family protein refolding chaperone [Bradyrhizobiaceae bacterium]
MWKTVLAATAAVAIAGSSLVYAQQRGEAIGAHHWSAEDISAFIDARVAALKAGLELTPDQQKNWPAFEQAYREVAKLRTERMKARFEQRGENINPIERLQKRADNLNARGAALKRLADAASPLYQSLDDAQKHRFVMLARPMGRHHREHFAGHMYRGQGADEEH